MPVRNLSRRAMLICGAGTALMQGLPARAQNSFAKPIQILVASSAGGTQDAVIRAIGPSLAKQLGQPVVIEPVPGAGGIVAMQRMMRAQDGHTFAWVGNGILSVTPQLKKSLGYDPKAVLPITRATTSSFLLLVSPKLGVNSVKELAAYAQANQLSFGSNGVNSSLHFLCEMIMNEGRFTALHVPYRGGVEANTALIAGDIQFMIDGPATVPLIRAGKLKAIAVTGAQREEAFPDVPTFAEQGYPGISTMLMFGLVAREGLSPSKIQDMSEAMKAALQESALRDSLSRLGYRANWAGPAEFKEVVDNELSRIAAIIKQKNIQPTD